MDALLMAKNSMQWNKNRYAQPIIFTESAIQYSSTGTCQSHFRLIWFYHHTWVPISVLLLVRNFAQAPAAAPPLQGISTNRGLLCLWWFWLCVCSRFTDGEVWSIGCLSVSFHIWYHFYFCCVLSIYVDVRLMLYVYHISFIGACGVGSLVYMLHSVDDRTPHYVGEVWRDDVWCVWVL